MKAEKIDWTVLQGAIITFVISIIISGGLIGITWYYQDKMQLEHNRQKARFQNISNQYLAVDQEERLIREFYPEFVELYNKGIIGQERRLSWIETLREAGEFMKLPALRYNIESQSRFIPDFPVNTGSFQIYSSPMKLNLELLHEGDLDRLLETLNSEAPGTYSISNCKLSRAGTGTVNLENVTRGNVNAECELRWLNIKKADGTEIKLSS